jgi:hypothetical protein
MEMASYAGFFETIRRTRWPFHIHNPESSMTGKKTNRVGGA